MELSRLDLKSFFFIALLIALGVILLKIFSPFLDVIIVALVIVQLFHPVYKFINKYIKSTGISSLLSTLITIVFVLIPLILILLLAASEITGLIEKIQPGLSPEVLSSSEGVLVQGVNTNNQNLTDVIDVIEKNLVPIFDNINNSLQSLGLNYQIETPDLSSLTVDFLGTISSQLQPIISSLISLSLSVIFFAFLLVLSLTYLFAEYDNLPKLISRISPLDDELDNFLFVKFTETTRAVIIGNFLVAIAQATSVSLMLLVLNIGAPVLLWLIMVFLSLVPVGSGLVWAPIGVGLILSGRPIEGIILIVYSAIIINVVDVTLRPQLLRNTTQLHPLVIIFSALGGIALFGPLGLLYGPLVAVFFTSLMDVYTRRYSGTKLHHEQT